MKASDVHAKFPRDGAETFVANVFAPSAPYCVHAPVGASGKDVSESDDGSIDRQPEEALAPTTAVERNVLRFTSGE
nr:hypothetical protein [Halorussus salinus]